MPRWLSALLVAALVCSLAPAPRMAASPAPRAPAQVAPAANLAADSTDFLLVVPVPPATAPTGTAAFDAAGYVNVVHAQAYTEVQAQLDAMAAQGLIAGYTAQPAAFAFALQGVQPEAAAQLAQLGRLQPAGELAAAAVDELAGAYQRQLAAAVAAQSQFAAAQPPPPAAPDQGSPAPAAPAETAALGTQSVSTASFTVQLHTNHVYGVVPAAEGMVVTATLKSPGGAVKAVGYSYVDSGDNADLRLNDTYGNPVTAEPGDSVEMQTPGLLTIPVVDLRLSADPSTGAITGVAPANVTNAGPGAPMLTLDLAPSFYIATTAAGTFALTNPDIRAGRSWQLSYTNAEGHSVIANGIVPVLALRGRYQDGGYGYAADEFVSGALVTPLAVVTVTVVRAGSPTVVNYTRANANGSFELVLADMYGNPVALEAGDTVQATDGARSISVQAPAFAVNSYPLTDTVAGVTNAVVVTDTLGLPQTLTIWPQNFYDWGYGKSVKLEGGAFRAENPFYWSANPANSPTLLDWGEGEEGHLRYLDAQGNAVYAKFAAPTAQPRLMLRSNGYGFSDNMVYGEAGGNYGYVTVKLLDAAGAVKDQVDAYNSYGFSASFSDVYGNPLPILDGDSVQATFNGRTTKVTAPKLLLAADPAADMVAGTISGADVTTTTFGAPQSLTIFAAMVSWSEERTVAPDTNGAFAASFSGDVDILPGMTGLARYMDAERNEVYSRWEAPAAKATVYLRGSSYYYWGAGYKAENYLAIQLPPYPCEPFPVQMTVRGPDGSVRYADSFTGNCRQFVPMSLRDDYDNAIDLRAGDVVEVVGAGQPMSVTVPAFAVVSDPYARTVSGETSAAVVTTTFGLTQTLVVWPDNLADWGYGKYVAVTAGKFQAENPFYWEANPVNWPQHLGWDPGDAGHLRYTDADGNMTYAAFGALVAAPELSIHKDGNYVSGLAPQGNAPVTVTVKSGATVKGAGYATTNLSGWFDVDLYDGGGNPLEIAEGDEVQFSEPVTSVIVPPLTINVDIDNDVVAGKGPANALLNVSQPDSPLEPPRSVPTAADGSYRAEFRGRLDLAPGVQVRVEYADPAGHTIWTDRYAGTQMAAALNTSRVWGVTPYARTPLALAVKRGGTVIATVQVVTDQSGFFIAFPADATGKPVMLAAGDVVELNNAGGLIGSLALAALTVSLDPQADTVTGTGPAASALGVFAHVNPGDFDASVVTNATGQWAVNLAAKGQNARPGDVASVRYTANGVDLTWAFAVAPYFRVRHSGPNTVEGFAPPFAPVTITLLRNGGVLAQVQEMARDDGFYYASLTDVNGLYLEIGAGDIVEVKSGTYVATVTVPPLTAVANYATRTVTGTGPANAMIGVSTWASRRTVKTGPDGGFAITYVNEYDLSGPVWLRYREPQGNWIHAAIERTAGIAPELRVRWNENEDFYQANAVSGNAGGGPRLVTLALRRSGQVVATATALADSSGYFNAELRTAAAEPMPIAAGDVVEMAAGDVTRSMTVPPLRVAANLTAQTLFGSGPPNTPLRAGDPYYGTYCWDSTTVDPTGNFVLQCNDLQQGASGWIWVHDREGNRTYLSWSTPVVRVRENGNRVAGTVDSGAAVQVRLLRGGTPLVETSTVADEWNGAFTVRFLQNGNPVLIRANDVVVVEAGGMITVPVVSLTATADSAADKVVGSGPPAGELRVYAETEGREVLRRITAGADGSYAAEFAGALDIRPGSYVEVAHTNDDGNEVYVAANAPLVRVNLSSDIVDGYATPLATATLVLKRGGAVLATAQAQTASNGAYSAFFLAGGSVVDLLPGDVVEVTASPTVVNAAIALTGTLDPQANTVSGTGPAGAPILVVAYRCAVGGCVHTSMTVIAGAGGAYVADFSGILDLDPTSYAYVQAADALGNQTSIATVPADVPRLTQVESEMASTGATLLKSAFGTANEDNLTPPLAVNVLGGGSLVFLARGGDLVVTAPDGTVTRPDGTRYTVQNPATGVWQVQLLAYNTNGSQYAVAVGQGAYNVYMPVVKQKQ
jgi:hypothetical protein